MIGSEKSFGSVSSSESSASSSYGSSSGSWADVSSGSGSVGGGGSAGGDASSSGSSGSESSCVCDLYVLNVGYPYWFGDRWQTAVTITNDGSCTDTIMVSTDSASVTPDAPNPFVAPPGANTTVYFSAENETDFEGVNVTFTPEHCPEFFATLVSL